MRFFYFIFFIFHFKAISAPLEIYLLLNGDNDLIHINEQGEVEQFSNKKYNEFVELSKNNPNIDLHVFYDRLEGNAEMTSVCDGIVDKKIITDEPYFFDKVHLNRLEKLSCAKNSQRILMYWGHGSSWTASQFDYSHSFETKFENYLELVKSNYELVIFDACSMGSFEIIHTLRKKTKYILASQFNLPLEGIQFDSLKQYREGLSTEQVFEEIFHKTMQKQQMKNEFAPLVLIKTKKIKKFEKILNKEMKKMKMSDYKLIEESIVPRDFVSDDGAVNLVRFFKLKGSTKAHQYLKEIFFNNYGSININSEFLIREVK